MEENKRKNKGLIITIIALIILLIFIIGYIIFSQLLFDKKIKNIDNNISTTTTILKQEKNTEIEKSLGEIKNNELLSLAQKATDVPDYNDKKSEEYEAYKKLLDELMIELRQENNDLYFYYNGEQKQAFKNVKKVQWYMQMDNSTFIKIWVILENNDTYYLSNQFSFDDNGKIVLYSWEQNEIINNPKFELLTTKVDKVMVLNEGTLDHWFYIGKYDNSFISLNSDFDFSKIAIWHEDYYVDLNRYFYKNNSKMDFKFKFSFGNNYIVSEEGYLYETTRDEIKKVNTSKIEKIIFEVQKNDYSTFYKVKKIIFDNNTNMEFNNTYIIGNSIEIN